MLICSFCNYRDGWTVMPAEWQMNEHAGEGLHENRSFERSCSKFFT